MAAKKTSRVPTNLPATRPISRAAGALVPIGEGSLPDYLRNLPRDERQRKSVGGGGVPSVKISSGLFLLPGTTEQGIEEFDSVALVALRRNNWWEGRYNADSASPPECGAIARLGEHENSMVPDPAYPNVQAESCRVCKQNVSPKACRNGLWIAMIHGDQCREERSAREASLVLLRISSTAIAPFGRTIRYLDEQGAPLHAALLRWQLRQQQGPGGIYYTAFATPTAWLPQQVAVALGSRVEEAEKFLLGAATPVVIPEDPGTQVEPVPAAPPRRRR